jgi:tRNA 2-thiouridine synthesizing protein D
LKRKIVATIGFLITTGYNSFWDIPYNIGRAALKKGHKVLYFLYLDGTYWPVKYQAFPQWKKQPKDKLDELIKMGAEFYACGLCINARGLRDGKDFIGGVKVAGLTDFADIISKSDRLITL